MSTASGILKFVWVDCPFCITRFLALEDEDEPMVQCKCGEYFEVKKYKVIK